MNEADAVGDRRKASAWPMFVALGLAVSELGVFLDGLYPVAVAGLLLFATSVAGILDESGYVTQPWRTMGTLGAVFVLAGAAIVVYQVGASVGAVTDAVDAGNGIVFRGFAIAAAGIVAGAAGVVGDVVDARRPFGSGPSGQ